MATLAHSSMTSNCFIASRPSWIVDSVFFFRRMIGGQEHLYVPGKLWHFLEHRFLLAHSLISAKYKLVGGDVIRGEHKPIILHEDSITTATKVIHHGVIKSISKSDVVVVCLFGDGCLTATNSRTRPVNYAAWTIALQDTPTPTKISLIAVLNVGKCITANDSELVLVVVKPEWRARQIPLKIINAYIVVIGIVALGIHVIIHPCLSQGERDVVDCNTM